MELQYFEKFEYTYKTYNGFTISKIIDELNKMGSDGWELIDGIKDEIGRNRYIFKRKITCTVSSSTSDDMKNKG